MKEKKRWERAGSADIPSASDWRGDALNQAVNYYYYYYR